MALRPRIVTPVQLEALSAYTDAIWDDCRELEKMWIQGELDGVITIEEEELEKAADWEVDEVGVPQRVREDPERVPVQSIVAQDTPGHRTAIARIW